MQIDKVITNPTDPIQIHVIGCGASGSYILTGLAQMSLAAKALNGKELVVVAWDGDVVTQNNMGRQLFTASDIGKHKSIVLCERINRFYGLNFIARPQYYKVPNGNQFPMGESGPIFITCTDSVSFRHSFDKAFKIGIKAKNHNNYNASHPLYWIDLGNDKDYGNVVLTDGKSKKSIIDYFPDMTENPEQPSCTLAESLGKQKLFVNRIVSAIALELLYQVLFEREVTWLGAFFRMSPELTIKTIKDEIPDRPKKKSKSTS